MTNIKNKVSILIPFQQHSYKTAEGMVNGNIIDKYYTTVYYNNSVHYKLLNLVLPHDLCVRMRHRCNEHITPYVKKYSELLGLVFLYSIRNKYFKKYRNEIRGKLFKSFALKASSDCMKRDVWAIWSFDTMSIDIYKNLDKQDSKIVRILDMASTCVSTIRRIIIEEYQNKYPFYQTFQRHLDLYTEEKCATYVEELRRADYLLVPSTWVKKSLLDVGISEKKIKYLPHGVDIVSFTPKKKSYILGDKLKFLFVGRAEGAKGIYYVLEAFKQLKNENIELIVVGDTFGLKEEYSQYTSNVKFLGLKRSDEMPDIYNECDVFILSSLWEGSSLSMLEALASGMPVIASKYSCAPDVIEDFIEGFVIEPRNIAQIKEKIIWFIKNREKIMNMGIAARKKAELNSWEIYKQNVCKIFEEIRAETKK